MKTSAIEHVKAKENVNISQLVQVEMSKGAIYSLNLAGMLVSLWVAACVVGGMIESGGPIAFVKEWFFAVTGL